MTRMTVATKKNASMIARQRATRPSATESTVSSGSSVNDTYAPRANFPPRPPFRRLIGTGVALGDAAFTKGCGMITGIVDGLQCVRNEASCS
jgi:hypothetical protein